MRAAAFVSESAQWQTTSWADHWPGAGRHLSASAGTLARADCRRAGPSAYCWIWRARSAADIGIGNALREGSGKVGAPHEIDVDRTRGAPALGDGPDDQGLAALHVTRGEDARDVSHPIGVAAYVAPLGESHAHFLEHPGSLGPHESHGEERQLARQDEVGARHLREGGAAAVSDRLHLDDLERPQLPMLVAEEALGRN